MAKAKKKVQVNTIENRIIKTELIDIDRLTPFQGKLKTLNDENFNKLRKSIIDEGFSFTMHVWENADVIYMIDGHQRLSVLTQMRKAGYIIPPLSCSFVSANTYRDAKKLVMAAISQFGKIQKDGFLEFVQGEDFDFEDYDFPNLDFNIDEVIKLKEEADWDESKEDEIPDDAPTRVQSGEMWKLGEHILKCGDSTSSRDVMELFGNRNASLCFTSPPYADQREYKGGKELSTEHLAKFISTAAHVCDLFAVNLGLCRRNDEVIRYWDDYIKEAGTAGLKLLSWNIWDRGAAQTIGQQIAMFAIEHEWIFVFGKTKKRLNRTVENKMSGHVMGGTTRQLDGSLAVTTALGKKVMSHKQIGTIIRMGVEKTNKLGHPAIFPVNFPIPYIEACTDPGDYVYEPFCGSGTTIIASEKSGRKCLAMELDPHYCDIILARWEGMTKQIAVKVD